MTNAKTVDTGIVAQAKIIGVTIVELQKSVETTDNLTNKLQEIANGLRAKGIVFGKSVKTCTWRMTISDVITTLCKEKTATKTCMNYVTSFAKSVNDGTPFSLSDSKGTAKGGKGKGTASPEFHALLAKAFSHKEFDAIIKKIQADFIVKYDNAENPSFSKLVESYLASEGYEITE
jgi:hypothetical protein